MGISGVKRLLLLSLILSGGWSGASSPAAAADAVADFYKGKQIRLIIGLPAGGGYDLYARALARHLGKHIPGNPTLIPQNMEGAGSRVASNWLFNVAPKDGTAIATVSQGTPLDQARGEQGVQFDVAKFGWIGNPIVDNGVTLSWSASGLTTMSEVKSKGGLVCGGTGASTPGITYPQILNNLSSAGIKIIAGYSGNPAITLAMERGEVNCLGGNTWASTKVQSSTLVKEKKLSVLVQWGPEKDPSIAAYHGHDVPLIMEYAKNEADRKVLTLINSGVALGRPLVAPPGIPADRLEALRTAFDMTMKDPEFLSDAVKQKMDISPLSGRKLQEIAVEVALTTADIVAHTNNLIAPKDVTELKSSK